MSALSVFRGDNRTFNLTVTDPASSDPVPITGWTFKFSVAKKKGGTLLFSVTGAITDDQNGKVSFDLTPTQTATVGKYFYDVQATTNAGKIYTIDSGTFEIVQDVTP